MLWDLRNARAPEKVYSVLNYIDGWLTFDFSDPERSRKRGSFVVVVQAGRKSPSFLR